LRKLGVFILVAVVGVLLYMNAQRYLVPQMETVTGGLSPKVTGQAPGQDADGSNPTRRAARVAEAYVVNVDTTGRPVPDWSPWGFAWRTPKGRGSGVVVREDGFIATNNHVVGDAQEIQVTLQDGKKYGGQLWARAPDYDLALIKIRAKGLHYARFADSDKDIAVGDPVIAVGNALGLGTTVTSGIISARERRVESQDKNNISLEAAIQTDAAINPGNSGGALSLLDGRLIGINTAIFSVNQGGGSIGIGFAIPSNTVYKAVQSLIQNRTFERPPRGFIGLLTMPMTPEIAQGAKAQIGVDYPVPTTGAWVRQVVPSGPADAGGIKSLDQILAVDGKAVKGDNGLSGIIQTRKPGDQVKVKLYRPALGREITLDVKLSGVPRQLEQQPALPQPSTPIPGWAN